MTSPPMAKPARARGAASAGRVDPAAVGAGEVAGGCVEPEQEGLGVQPLDEGGEAGGEALWVPGEAAVGGALQGHLER